MGTAKQRLDLKPGSSQREAEKASTLQMPALTVKVHPQVDVKVPPPQLNMDAAPFTKVLAQLSSSMNQIATQQLEILRTVKQQNEVLAQLVTKEAPAPVTRITNSRSPSDFSVELEKVKGQTVGMRIRAEPVN